MSAHSETILWWETRRVPFNLAVGLAGIVTTLIVVGVGDLLVKPGEDIIEPVLLLFGSVLYGVMANVFYCLGWLSELLWAGSGTSNRSAFRNRIFRLGLVGSVALTLLPAVAVIIVWMCSGFPTASPSN